MSFESAVGYPAAMMFLTIALVIMNIKSAVMNGKLTFARASSATS